VDPQQGVHLSRELQLARQLRAELIDRHDDADVNVEVAEGQEHAMGAKPEEVDIELAPSMLTLTTEQKWQQKEDRKRRQDEQQVVEQAALQLLMDEARAEEILEEKRRLAAAATASIAQQPAAAGDAVLTPPLNSVRAELDPNQPEHAAGRATAPTGRIEAAAASDTRRNTRGPPQPPRLPSAAAAEMQAKLISTMQGASEAILSARRGGKTATVSIASMDGTLKTLDVDEAVLSQTLERNKDEY
jgi:hypothetical protein